MLLFKENSTDLKESLHHIQKLPFKNNNNKSPLVLAEPPPPSSPPLQLKHSGSLPLAAELTAAERHSAGVRAPSQSESCLR